MLSFKPYDGNKFCRKFIIMIFFFYDLLLLQKTYIFLGSGTTSCCNQIMTESICHKVLNYDGTIYVVYLNNLLYISKYIKIKNGKYCCCGRTVSF